MAGALFLGYHRWPENNILLFGRMTPPLPRIERRHPWLAIMVVLSLLFTQWLGFGHAIAHGNGLPEFSQSKAKVGALPEHQKSSSTCAALDAATLAAGMPMTSFAIAFTALAGGPIILPLRTGWHRLFTAHFSSRAPPSNT